MEEALIEDIREYPSLSKLFTRQLKEDARIVSSDCLVVSSSVSVCGKPHLHIVCLPVHLSDNLHLLRRVHAMCRWADIQNSTILSIQHGT